MNSSLIGLLAGLALCPSVYAQSALTAARVEPPSHPVHTSAPEVRYADRPTVWFSQRPDVRYSAKPDVWYSQRPDVRYAEKPDVRYSERLERLERRRSDRP